MGVGSKDWKGSLQSLSKRVQNEETISSANVPLPIINKALDQGNFDHWHDVSEILSSIEDKDLFFKNFINDIKKNIIPPLVKNVIIFSNTKKWSGLEDILDIIHFTLENSTAAVGESYAGAIGSLICISRTEDVGFSGQLEAMKLVNLIVEELSKSLLEKQKHDEEFIVLRDYFPRHLAEAGDYEFQATIVEAIFRFLSTEERSEIWKKWFTTKELQQTCYLIRNEQFETGCRKFLNVFNESRDKSRRVFSYPCVSASLGKQQLSKPKDDQMPEFWVDFNLRSKSISLFVDNSKSSSDGGSWEIVVIKTDDVQDFRFHDNGRDNVFILKLIEPSYLLLPSFPESPEKYAKILFSRIYPIQSIVDKLFGKEEKKTSHEKCEGKSKTSISVIPLQLNSFAKPKSIMKPYLYSGASSSEDQMKSSPVKIKRMPAIQEETPSRNMPSHLTSRRVPQLYNSTDDEAFIELPSLKLASKKDDTIIIHDNNDNNKLACIIDESASQTVTIPETQVEEDDPYIIDLEQSTSSKQATNKKVCHSTFKESTYDPNSLARPTKSMVKNNTTRLNAKLRTEKDVISVDSPFTFPVTPQVNDHSKKSKLHMLKPARKQPKKAKSQKKTTSTAKQTKSKKAKHTSESKECLKSSNLAPEKRSSSRLRNNSQSRTMPDKSIAKLYSSDNVIDNVINFKVSKQKKDQSGDEPTKRKKKQGHKHIDVEVARKLLNPSTKKAHEHIDIEIETKLYEVIETTEAEETPYKPYTDLTTNEGMKHLPPRSLLDDFPLMKKSKNKVETEIMDDIDLLSVKTPSFTPYQSDTATVYCPSVSSNITGKLYYNEGINDVSDCDIDIYDAASEGSVIKMSHQNEAPSSASCRLNEKQLKTSSIKQHDHKGHNNDVDKNKYDFDERYNDDVEECRTRSGRKIATASVSRQTRIANKHGQRNTLSTNKTKYKDDTSGYAYDIDCGDDDAIEISTSRKQAPSSESTSSIFHQPRVPFDGGKRKTCSVEKDYYDEGIDDAIEHACNIDYQTDDDIDLSLQKKERKRKTQSVSYRSKATVEPVTNKTCSTRKLQHLNGNDAENEGSYCNNVGEELSTRKKRKEKHNHSAKLAIETPNKNLCRQQHSLYRDHSPVGTKSSSAADLIGYRSPIQKYDLVAESSDEIENVSEESEEINFSLRSVPKRSKQSTKRKTVTESKSGKTTHLREVPQSQERPLSPELNFASNSFADICKGIISQSRNRSIVIDHTAPKKVQYPDINDTSSAQVCLENHQSRYGRTSVDSGIDYAYHTERSFLATPLTNTKKKRKDVAKHKSKRDQRGKSSWLSRLTRQISLILQHEIRHDTFLQDFLATPSGTDEDKMAGETPPDDAYDLWDSHADDRNQRNGQMQSYVDELLKEFDEQDFSMRLGSLEEDVSTFTKKFSRDISTLKQDYNCSMHHVSKIVDSIKTEFKTYN